MFLHARLAFMFFAAFRALQLPLWRPIMQSGPRMLLASRSERAAREAAAWQHVQSEVERLSTRKQLRKRTARVRESDKRGGKLRPRAVYDKMRAPSPKPRR